MISAIIPFVLALIGGVLYIVSTNAKIQELGRIMFAAGVFAIAFVYSGARFTL